MKLRGFQLKNVEYNIIIFYFELTKIIIIRQRFLTDTIISKDILSLRN